MNFKAKHRAEMRAFADAQQAVTRCAECRWSFRGLIRDGRRAFREHRLLKHGVAK